MRKINKKVLLIICVVLTGMVVLIAKIMQNDNPITASTVVTSGDFTLTAENKWDKNSQKNYVQLNWKDEPNLGQGGYQLYQSEDGVTWGNRSFSYGKSINVLNVYPTTNQLEGWMSSLLLKDENGDDLIKVSAVSLDTFNNSPYTYLPQNGDYIYDVVMFGSSDYNSHKDLSTTGKTAVQSFVDSGRGVLFGHDTITPNDSSHTQFNSFADQLGLKLQASSFQIGGEKLQITDNGYLMKYPFELQNNQTLSVPRCHSWGQGILPNSTARKWLQFTGTLNWNIPGDSSADANFYLVTNNNLGMIQTGHSGGSSTLDERKIIANTLYNLAQVSKDNFGNDQTVTDGEPPKNPTILMDCEGITVDAVDEGKEYQWYVEANTKSNGVKKSDIVKETITSNIAGYFYVIDDQVTSSLASTIDAKKNEFGRITEDIYTQTNQGFTGISVDPKTDDVSYDTKRKITGIDRYKDAGKYRHVVAVDRMSNISEVTTTQIKEIPSNLSYEIERTKDELTLVDLNLSDTLNNKMKAIEIQVPSNTEIKDYTTLKNHLPTNWDTFENSSTDTYKSYGFSMKASNDISTIKSFLEALTFTITKDKNNAGNIKIIFREEVFTSWVDSDNINHYYKFVDSDNLTWMECYNLAKKEKYKGLTGYLATLTSKKEHEHVYYNIADSSGWLGGTRMVQKSPKQKLNDSVSISTNINDYDTGTTNGNQWYWVNGPETGQVFFDRPTFSGGGKAPEGMYQGFNNRDGGGTGLEPNSAEEYVLEFAQASAAKSMYWNDLNFNKHGTTHYKTGYYVEFSEYGNQVETELDEKDVAWCSRIPQKIELKAYDEKGNRVESGDMIYDQQLRIGQIKTVEPTELPRYKFLELREVTDEVRTNYKYIVSNEYQEGKLIYGYRNGTLHVRQVIVNKQDEVIIPSKGYGALTSYETLESNQSKEKTQVITPSSSKEDQLFDTVMFTFDSKVPIYRYEAILPMYYQLKGYVLTTDENETHLEGNASIEQPVMNFSGKTEYWLTTYLEPVLESPGLYHWEYKKNDLGSITEAEPSP